MTVKTQAVRMTRTKTLPEIEAMREGGHMLATVLDLLEKNLQPGMSTKELSYLASKELSSLGGKPAFLDYQGYPDILCVSINDEVVHGIPKATRIIQEGDVVGLDFGVKYKGLITDGARSILAGTTASNADRQLVAVTKQSLEAGIDALHDGVKVGDISAAVQTVLNKNRLGIVRDLVGHGVGDYLHEEPNIPNFGSKNTGPTLKTGMTIAIEPMATLGDWHVFITKDGWTVCTKDGSRAAHFEHTVLITPDGAEILTQL